MATLFQYYNSGDDGEKSIWGDSIIGQQFTVSTAHSIEYVKLKMREYPNSSPGNLVVEIKGVDGDGKPTGEALCSATVNANDYNDPSQWRTITFSTSADLQADTMYAILCHDEDWNGSSSVNVLWARDTTSPTYSGGSQLLSINQGTSWAVQTSRDMMFEEWGTEIEITTGAMLPSIAPALETLWSW